MTGDAFPAPAAGAQSHVERAPAPALRDMVSSVWVQQIGRDAEPYPHRRIPDGAVDLVCRVGSAPQVIGPLTEPLVETLQPGSTVVGLRLVPGAFPALTGRPASEVVGLVVDAEELWGRSAAALGEAVGAAASPRQALAAMQRHVHERACVGRPSDPLVHEAVRGLLPWHSAGVTSLSASLRISETQLRRRFRTAVGLAPKALHRMLRFQRFLALAQNAIGQGHAPTGDSLAALAPRVGYADQSHLTRECVRLTGVSPRVFLEETRRTCACDHDHSASFVPVLRAEASV